MKITDITHRNDLSLFLNKNKLIDTGAEVGVSKGSFANQILKKWLGKKIFLVDIWNCPEIKKEAQNRLEVYKDRYQFIHKPSVAAATDILDNSLDFCYIDACHRYSHVKEDLNAWWSKVKEGGLFCGHDYSVNEKVWLSRRPHRKEFPHFGVAQAVDEFVKEKNLTLHVEPVPGDTDRATSWYIFKK
jgi:predicted O-methyltransferase YrrM